jgi:hypothetical protein
MRRAVVGGVALVAALVPSLALALTSGEFVAKADKLKAQGMMAMMSSDLGLLQREMKAVGQAWRADVDTARAQGRTDLGCPPPKGQVKMPPDQLVAAFRAMPAATPLKQAFYRHMAQRFPCR